MAYYEHPLIYKKAMDLAIYFELETKIVSYKR